MLIYKSRVSNFKPLIPNPRFSFTLGILGLIPEIRNQDPGIWDLEFGTWNLDFGSFKKSGFIPFWVKSTHLLASL